MDVAMSMS